MHAKNIFAAVALIVVAGAALAQPIGTAPTRAAADKANLTAESNYPVLVFKSSKTRAEVIAELQRARERGLVSVGERYPVIPTTPGNKTRSEVSNGGAPHDDSLYAGA